MSAIPGMVRKDLVRKLRSPVSLVVMLIFPLAFAGMLGLAFGDRGGSAGLPRIKILLADLDDDFLSQFVMGATNSDEFNEQFELISVATEAEGRRLMDDGAASALLVIPEGFTRDLLDERPVTLTLVKNPAQSILPQVVEELASLFAVVVDNGVRVLGDPLRELDRTFEGVDEADDLPANDILAQTTVTLATRIRPLLHYVFPPVLRHATVDEDEVALEVLLQARAGETAAEAADRVAAAGGAGAASRTADTEGDDADSGSGGGGVNLFAYFLPMISLMAILFIGENGMRDILVEQRAGTLMRLFASPAGVRQVVVAKIVTTLLLCAASLALLAAVGLAVGWVSPSVSLPGALVQLGAVALASTGLATLVYGFVRTDRAASATHSALVMAMSFLGGSFMPYEQFPDGLKRVAPLTINYWGIEGIKDLTLRGGGVGDVLTEAGVLAAVGVLGIAAGSLVLARRFAAGGAT